MWFTSDNASGAAPEVMAAVARANEGYARSYGADALMDRARDLVREVFEAPEAAVYLVTTGTVANALSLSLLTPPWGSVFCHTHAHIAEDECGAPEFYSHGAKLTLIPGAHGRMEAGALEAAILRAKGAGVHGVQPGALSITNVTEAGTVYSVAEIAELAGVARAHGVPVHLDGARFANALVATGATAADMTWRAGVDVVSFGGTKNGCMGVEAVVIFDPAKAWEFELRRKRAGHLMSKHRFLSAQMGPIWKMDFGCGWPPMPMPWLRVWRVGWPRCPRLISSIRLRRISCSPNGRRVSMPSLRPQVRPITPSPPRWDANARGWWPVGPPQSARWMNSCLPCEIRAKAPA